MTVVDAAAKLLAQVHRIPDLASLKKVTVSESVPGQVCVENAIALLHNNRTIADRVLFRPRSDASCNVTLGFGAYRSSETLEDLLPHISETTRILGAGSFEGGVDSDGRWIIPRLLITTTATRITLTLSFDSDERDQVVYFLRSFDGNTSCPSVPNLRVLTESFSISEKAFSTLVDEALMEIRSGSLEKVVLSVKKTFKVDQVVDPSVILLAISRSLNLEQRYVFFLSNADRTFLSLSPERLVALSSEGCLETEALAGTFTAKDSGEDDKLTREHGQVTEYILDRLKEISDGPIEIASREVVSLGASINHWREKLWTRVIDFHPSQVVKIVRLLHPTPAVCGFPLSSAQAFIGSKLGIRGFFCAPCGEVSINGAEFLVGIRGLEIDHTTCEISAQAGAGIVQGSVPEKEWEEIMNKMHSVTHSFDHSFVGLHLSNMTVFSCFLLLENLRRLGVREVAMSPGSRSSPMVIAADNLGLKVHLFIDERSTGFFALGRSKAGKVVPVIVTSGTAVANLAPALAEASTAGVGVLVISCDRETFQTGTGENQALDHQDQLFRGMKDVLSRQVGLPVRSYEQAAGILSDASFAHFQVTQGRVFHFNLAIPYQDLTPLSTEQSKRAEVISFIHGSLKRWLDSSDPFTRHVLCLTEIPSLHLSATLFVAGDLQTERVAPSLLAALQRSAVVISDSLSGISSRWPLLIHSRALRDVVSDSVRTIVWLGGNLINKQVQNWLASLGARVIRVSSSRGRLDPQFITSVYCHMKVSDFLASIRSKLLADLPPFASAIAKAEAACDKVLSATLWAAARVSALTEPLVSFTIAENWKREIFLGAGMACRDFDSFGFLEGVRKVFMNRGANGIDGLIASAIGASNENPLLLVLGDCSCMYDLSSLSSLKNFPLVRVVVLNNSGGGIFRFLRNERHSLVASDRFKSLWEMSHGFQLASVAEALTVKAVQVETLGTFIDALDDPTVQFIECIVPRSQENVALHQKLSQRLASKIDQAILGDEGLQYKWLCRHETSEALIILLHGWLGSADDWREVCRNIKIRADFVAVEINLPTDTPSLFCHRLNRLVEALSATAQRDVFFIGYSMGGRLAMHYASLFPVSGIVLISACPDVQPSLQRSEIFEKLTNEDFLSYWYTQVPLFAQIGKRYPSVTHRNFSRETASAQLENLSTTRSCDRLKILGVVVGSLDEKYTLEARKSGLPTFSIQDAGHALLLESHAVASVASAIEKFLVAQGLSKDAAIESGFFRIDDFFIEDYCIPLELADSELLRSATVREFRRGFLVRTTSVLEINGRQQIVRGIGEIPEPIRNARNLDDLRHSAEDALSRLIGQNIVFSADRIKLIDSVRAHIQGRDLIFVFEQLMLTSIADSIPSFPLAAVVQRYIVLALSGPSFSEMFSAIKLNSLEKFHGPGIPVKLKVGGDPIQDAHRVNDFCERYPDVQLRLDANQLWTSDQALLFARSLSARAVLAIEYIEEPVSQPKRGKLKAMMRNVMWRDIRIALDESIEGKSELWTELAEDKEFTLVLKPYLFNIRDTLTLLNSGHVTLSTTFETGVGLCFLVCLAAAIGGGGHHGLYPHPAMTDRYTAEYAKRVVCGRAQVVETEKLLSQFL